MGVGLHLDLKTFFLEMMQFHFLSAGIDVHLYLKIRIFPKSIYTFHFSNCVKPYLVAPVERDDPVQNEHLGWVGGGEGGDVAKVANVPLQRGGVAVEFLE